MAKRRGTLFYRNIVPAGKALNGLKLPSPKCHSAIDGRWVRLSDEWMRPRESGDSPVRRVARGCPLSYRPGRRRGCGVTAKLRRSHQFIFCVMIDREMLRRHLAQAEELELDGHDTRQAKELSAEFEVTLRLQIDDRDRLRAELDRAGRSQSL
jgi:hypothetical protein